MEKTTKNPKEVHIIGGRTEQTDWGWRGDEWEGNTHEVVARKIAKAANEQIDNMDVYLHLTDPSGGNEGIRSDRDVMSLCAQLVGSMATKMVFFSAYGPNMFHSLSGIRNAKVNGNGPRKDIFLSHVNITGGFSKEMQFCEQLDLVKKASSNLGVAYDIRTNHGMIVGPEESAYDETDNLDQLVNSAIDMAELRSHLTFTRSTVIDGEPVDWNSSLIYPSLREVVDYCVRNDAYKPFLGVTAGHFAAKIGENEFLTSRRKTDFRDLAKIGLVRVVTDGPDNVIAYGAKPSVGGQSQRIVFDEHKGENCIVHFHCPIKPGSNVPTVSQREYECGSHECGQNTSRGLEVVDDGIKAVYLDNHGPNIVFNDGKDPRSVQEFVSDNFDLSKKTGGYQVGGY
jgi:hypothetical protein